VCCRPYVQRCMVTRDPACGVILQTSPPIDHLRVLVDSHACVCEPRSAVGSQRAVSATMSMIFRLTPLGRSVTAVMRGGAVVTCASLFALASSAPTGLHWTLDQCEENEGLIWGLHACTGARAKV
jgi:hypothetical protein